MRSTHGVSYTGSCSWKIYVKNGLVTWETQQTDYPRTRPELPNHEPRGCPGGEVIPGIYTAPIGSHLLKLWRIARTRSGDGQPA